MRGIIPDSTLGWLIAGAAVTLGWLLMRWVWDFVGGIFGAVESGFRNLFTKKKQ